MYKKFILDMDDDDINNEVADILGEKIEKPKEQIGWITDDPNSYSDKNGVIDIEKLNGLYTNGPFVKKYITTLVYTSLRRRPKELFDLIRKLRKGKEVLEYGCGTATHGIASAQMGANAHIFDISSTMLDFAKKRFNKRNLDVNVYDKTSKIPKNYFDVIVCTDVMEHVPNPIKVLYDFISYLKKDGILFLHVAYHISLEKGHLPQAINMWKNSGNLLLSKFFKKVSGYEYSKK